MLKRVLVKLIKFYQIIISPYLGQNCRFYPSCSDYFILALERRGFCVGLFLGLKRILRCHPWHPGGIDALNPKP